MPVFVSGQTLAGCYTLRSLKTSAGDQIIWRAWDEVLEVEVELDFLPASFVGDARAMEELRAVMRRSRQLVAPHAQRLYDLVEEPGWSALVLEYVEGKTLEELLAARPLKRFDPSEIAGVITQLCATLDQSHKLQLTHRSVTPEDVVVTASAGIKLSPPAVRRLLRDHASREAGQKNPRTLAYLSPQQLDGEAPHPTDDVYSVGILIHELLTGTIPFAAEDVLAEIRRKVPAPVSERRAALGEDGEPVGKSWDKTVAQCLEKSRDGRIKKAAEIPSRIGIQDTTEIAPALLQPAPADVAKTGWRFRRRKTSEAGVTSEPPLRAPAPVDDQALPLVEPPAEVPAQTPFREDPEQPAPATSKPEEPQPSPPVAKGPEQPATSESKQPTTGTWIEPEKALRSAQRRQRKEPPVFASSGSVVERSGRATPKFPLGAIVAALALVALGIAGYLLSPPGTPQEKRDVPTPSPSPVAQVATPAPEEPPAATEAPDQPEIAPPVAVNPPASPTPAPEPTATPTPAPAATPEPEPVVATPSPAATPEQASLVVTPDAPRRRLDETLENSLGMKFARVGEVLVCIWPTRVVDYNTFVKSTGYRETERRAPGFKQGLDHPVVNVSWEDAMAFCRWLTEKEHREGTLPEDHFYRLPTDLEWSTAVGLPKETGSTPEARDMGIQDVFPWGTQWPPPVGAGNYTGEETGSDVAIRGYDDGYVWTSPVGSFTPNQFGLFDMGGNVWEWCMDSWNNDSGGKVLRGGSWYNGALKLSLLSSCRIRAAASSTADNYGFRCVVVPRDKKQ
jgi:serine/threonine protein kinase